MKHIVKIMTLLVATGALWIGLLQTSVISPDCTLMLPVYLIVSLGCYGLLMVGVGLMQFPTCPQESLLLQQMSPKGRNLICNLLWFFDVLIVVRSILPQLKLDIIEAKTFLKKKGVDVGSD